MPDSPTIAKHGLNVLIATVSNILQAESSDAIDLADYADRSIQLSGTFGAASIGVTGSNDGVTYSPLHDPAGDVIAITVAGISAILEYTPFVKIVATGGGGTTDLTAVISARK